MTKLILPMPPTVNTYWRKGKNGRIYLSEKAVSFKNDVVWSVKAQNPKRYTNGERLAVSVVLNFPTRAKTDIDNRLKGLLDALTNAGVYSDDSQIDVLAVARGELIKGGQCTVEIDEIGAKQSRFGGFLKLLGLKQ